MQVKEIMSRQAVTVGPRETASSAARLLSRANVGAVPVCTAEGQLRGILTDRDVALRCVAAGRQPEKTVVGEIMTRRVATVEPETEVSQACLLMAREQVRRLPVTQSGRLVGMVSLTDVLRAGQPEAAGALAAVCQGVRMGEFPEKI